MVFFLLYVFTQIEKIQPLMAMGSSIFTWSLVLWGGIYVVSLLASRNKEHLTTLLESTSKIRKWSVFFAVVGSMMFVLSHVLPSKKDLAIIVSAGVTYKVLTSDEAKEIGGKALDLLKKQLDEAINSDEVKVVDKVVEEAKTIISKKESKVDEPTPPAA